MVKLRALPCPKCGLMIPQQVPDAEGRGRLCDSCARGGAMSEMPEGVTKTKQMHWTSQGNTSAARLMRAYIIKTATFRAQRDALVKTGSELLDWLRTCREDDYDEPRALADVIDGIEGQGD